MSVLFLFGILIKKIELDKKFNTVIKNKGNISFNIRFADYVNVDINLEDLLTEWEIVKPVESVENIIIDLGKTFLFTSSLKDVLATMKNYPLEVAIYLTRKNEGTVFHMWKQEFFNVLKRTESGKQDKPCYMSIKENFITAKKSVIGSCDFCLQFSCCTQNIQHSFFVDIVNDCDIYINDFSKKPFKCYNYERLISEQSEIPLFTLSWSTLKSKDDSNKGIYLDELEEQLETKTIDSEIPDVVSLRFRPPEQKYFDLVGMLTANVTTTSRGTCLTLTVDKISKRYLGDASLDDTTKGRIYPFDSMEDQINKNLCESKDCPAAMKLKDFGYGPLATSNGLGTIYGDVKCTTSYGMSQTYGTFCRYGPYGMLLENDQNTVEEIFSTKTDRKPMEDDQERHIQFTD